MNDLETIAHCRRELRADPQSLRFVQLADALRRVGRVREAEAVLADGILIHGRLNSARLVLARLFAGTERHAEALAILDDLYPKDSGNVALVGLYLELLVWASRSEEAAELLRRAEIVGVPEEVRHRAQEFLEADRWAAKEEAVKDGAAARRDVRAELGDPVTLPDTSVMTFVDPFAVPAVARRLEKSGRLEAALRIWEEVALVRPDQAESDAHLDALRGGAVPNLAGGLPPRAAAAVSPPPTPLAERRLLRFLRALEQEQA